MTVVTRMWLQTVEWKWIKNTHYSQWIQVRNHHQTCQHKASAILETRFLYLVHPTWGPILKQQHHYRPNQVWHHHQFSRGRNTITDCGIITKPLDTDKYHAIRERLISAFLDSEKQHTQRLLTEIELGDCKLSQLLCKMKILVCNKVSENFLKRLWQVSYGSNL